MEAAHLRIRTDARYSKRVSLPFIDLLLIVNFTKIKHEWESGCAIYTFITLLVFAYHFVSVNMIK